MVVVVLMFLEKIIKLGASLPNEAPKLNKFYSFSPLDLEIKFIRPTLGFN